ncbi:MAG: RNA polymerase sigma factor [Bacillota bacterium]
MSQSPDAVALSLCRRGQEEGFRRLIDTYRGYIYSLCFSIISDREEALDACQEVFLAVFRGLRNVREDAPLKPWLRRVTVNVCLNYRDSPRSGRRAVPVDGQESGGGPSHLFGTDPDPARVAELAETRVAVRAAIAELPADQRLAVVLYHQEGQSYDEISSATGWPLGTVKTNLYRGRKELGKRLRFLRESGETDE